MFEPVHGSAPKHFGQDKANPIATIASASMMLEYLAEKNTDDKMKLAKESIDRAIEQIIADRKILTYDLGGNSKCSEVGEEISRIILSSQ